MGRMLPQSARLLARAFGWTTLAFMLALGLAQTDTHRAAAAAGLFTNLSGSWSGNGSIKLSSGASERIRCRATYDPDGTGNSLRQSLVCASDSYKFNLKSNIKYSPNAGVITGTWAETSYNTVGRFSGRFRDGQIRATVEGDGFLAHLTVVTRGNQQSVTISSKGTQVTDVSIKLSRKSR